MYRTNNLPSFETAFSGLYSSPLDLINQPCQLDASERQPVYQGMSVQMLDSPFPTYVSQSDADQNNAYSVNPLNEYNIKSLTSFDPENYLGTGINELPQSVLDELVPYNSDNELVSDTLPLTPSIPIFQQLSGNEPEIRTPTPVNYSNLGYQLTNPSAEPPNQQDLRPAAAVHPLCMHQTISEDQGTHAKESVNDSSSLVERQRVRKREYQRERSKDPAYAERERVRKKKYLRERRKDPAYAERERMHRRECQRERRKDPAYVERERMHRREYQRERCKDPAYAERERVRKREYKRERCKDPAYAEHQREYQRECRKDPAYAECQKVRQRERRKDPAYVECERVRERERRKDPAYAEGQNIYSKTYKRIKRQTSNKEEASRQAKIAKEQYLQSVNSARNLCELPLTSNLIETPPQSSSKNLDGAPSPLFSCQNEGIVTVLIEPISP